MPTRVNWQSEEVGACGVTKTLFTNPLVTLKPDREESMLLVATTLEKRTAQIQAAG